MEIEHNQHIGIYKNVFEKEYCDDLIEFFETNSHAQYFRRENEGGALQKKDTSITLPDYRIAQNKSFHVHFNEIFYEHVFPKYVEQYPEVAQIGENHIRTFKIQKTKPSEGYHIWHYEQGRHIGMNRIGAYSLYLNDDFEGGETEFLYQSMRIKPEAGTVIIFPASYPYVHRGNPPIGGTKYIVTGWIEL